MFIGVDLAWRESTSSKIANQSGVVALEASGLIIDAEWTVGIDETAAWIEKASGDDTVAFIDAPLVVNNPAKTSRLCEREVSQRYMSPWKVGANSTNIATERLGGVRLRDMLEAEGWAYDDGTGVQAVGRRFSECYPYTTIVGADALGYATNKPLYKRKPKNMKMADWRALRAGECDELIRRVAQLKTAEPPVDLTSHETTGALLESPSPLDDVAYKGREDLLDAVLCAWTAAYWSRFGRDRCQILGLGDAPDVSGHRATIIAPARPEQRRDDLLP